MDELKCIYSRTKTIQEDKVSGFCRAVCTAQSSN